MDAAIAERHCIMGGLLLLLLLLLLLRSDLFGSIG